MKPEIMEQATPEKFFELAKARVLEQRAGSCQVAIVFMLMAIYTLLKDRMQGD